MSKGIVNHVGLTVGNMDEAVRFWTEFLGMPPTHRGTMVGGPMADLCGIDGVTVEGAKFDLPNSAYLELYDYKAADRQANGESTANIGNIHFCLWMDDVRSSLKRALDLGARCVSKNGLLAIHKGPSAGTSAVYLRIHDGITLELVGPTVD